MTDVFYDNAGINNQSLVSLWQHGLIIQEHITDLERTFRYSADPITWDNIPEYRGESKHVHDVMYFYPTMTSDV